MAIGSAAIGGATAGFSYLQQRADYKTQTEMQDYNNQIIMNDAINQYGQLGESEHNVQENMLRSLLDNQLDVAAQQANAKLLAGASGTQGGSVNSMLFDIAQTGGRNQANIIYDRNQQLSQITKQAESIRYGARRQMGTRSFARPSALRALQGGIQTGMSSYNFSQAFNNL